MSGLGVLRLEKRFFTGCEEEILSYRGLSAAVFAYESGVCGAHLKNDRGCVTVLPFRGQQIWDAIFDGRRLTMKSPVGLPKETGSFITMYGCFMMHCGAFRMGCPGPEDDHPLHGELPLAQYDSAEIVFGDDDRGPFIGITGIYAHDIACSVHYRARPAVKIHAGSGLIDISLTVENRSWYGMELMYMCHINFRPVPEGRIVQSAPWDPEHLVLRTSIPKHVSVSEEFLQLMNRLKENPEASKIIKPDDEYKPEIVFFIQSPSTDEDGKSHFMQVHPDGSADYVGYRPQEFDHAARWIVRTKDQEALGIALPATCDPEGYTAEKRKGNIKTVEGYGSMQFDVAAGLLEAGEAEKMEGKIRALVQ